MRTRLVCGAALVAAIASTALGQAASHVVTSSIGGAYTYTIFNDEPGGSTNFLSLFTVRCNAPIVVSGTPAGWTFETDGFTYVTWANTDAALPFPNEVAPGSSRTGFAILALAGADAVTEYEAFTWNHAANTRGPNTTGTLSAPAIGEFTRCPADLDFDADPSTGWTPDGAVTINDLISFLIGFEDGNLAVDLDDDGLDPIDPDGAVTIEDLIFFLARFEQGC